jgi:hypothetical protein
VAYANAVRAAALPWNHRRERRAAPSTKDLDRPAACLNSRPKPCTIITAFVLFAFALSVRYAVRTNAIHRKDREERKENPPIRSKPIDHAFDAVLDQLEAAVHEEAESMS